MASSSSAAAAAAGTAASRLARATATTTAAAAAPTKKLAVANAVHVRVTPAPAGLAESRQVLRVLQRFGEVVMFKNLRYQAENPVPNASLAIFRDDDAAENLLRASPLRFSLEPVTAPSSSASASSSPAPSSSSSAADLDPDLELDSDPEFSAALSSLRYPPDANPSTEPAPSSRPRNAEEMTRPSRLLNNRTELRPGMREEFRWPMAAVRRRKDKDKVVAPWDVLSGKSGGHGFGLGTAEARGPVVRDVESLGSVGEESGTRSSEGWEEEDGATLDPAEAEAEAEVGAGPAPTPAPTPGLRTFHLHARHSLKNHQDWIEHSRFWWHFQPHAGSAPQQDLARQVPTPGLSDVAALRKGSRGQQCPPARVRAQEAGRIRARMSLAEMWDEGERRRRQGREG
ncbi:hypothetical protein BDY21DRAFT_374823 [Lineolata rhizophorae]|uniref:RRM domain-containing protein n=1 Tax=Lineolata rhizophorae TaxID=578093 RepID=A0A6A6NQC9_9PEZI|nr:hypothetical protein BDY21DRAFT_374823 [Lineolata rhizophorae]